MDPTISSQIYYLQQLAQEQSILLTALQERIVQLEKEVSELKKRPQTVFEKVEYKFDQLKVERLEGTLNIGLNPLQAPSIDDFTVENQSILVQKQPQFDELRQYITDRIQKHLKEDAWSQIRGIEESTRSHVDDYYRQMMIDDIRNQMETRIPYYISQFEDHPDFSVNPSLFKEEIIQKMLQDINQAFVAFLHNLPENIRKGNN
ncbi:spore gernimation protein GerPC [Bacillus sp. RG28]|uniref:Spore gernimation protein GerPC n=1 Tax=Gottfriedia endophytica TaxID=2820819 RepID=A0A940NLV2_9BACI|nr:spore germination protein GerPC [Gottfriedia endophytica]MBP0724559.1 spore gernimation protein GerPC [Gottfriedia endophytica]